ncbi:MAG: 2-hydroxychromene-2-carboxylate isomerase [Alphaproteobacteria bacterium]|nr:2-hydroxychromene-2-carboxylate isomerase [Alphaproteobacteria bacterium]
MVIHFYYDVVCPYAYMASTRIEALAARYGAEVEWKPILLGGVFKSIAAPQRPADTWSSERQVQIARDLLRQAAYWGVPLRMHPRHPVRSVDAMRLILVADPADRPALSRRLYRAYFEESADIDDPAVLGRIGAEYGLDAAGVKDPAIKAELHARTAEAVSRGVFGVPAVFVEGKGWWWGQDRLHFVEAALGGPAHHPGFTGPRTGGALRFFHDFASPFSYLASTQIQALADARGAALTWSPILLGALFRDIGTPDVPLFEMSAPKAQYYARDLADWAAWWGVPFGFPSTFPVRTVLPLRVALQDQRAVAPLYRALWAEDRDIGDPAVVAEVLQEAGLDARGLIEGAQDPAIKAALRANTEEARALGVCGVPTTLVNGAQLIWGQDRLGLVDAALTGAMTAV